MTEVRKLLLKYLVKFDFEALGQDGGFYMHLRKHFCVASPSSLPSPLTPLKSRLLSFEYYSVKVFPAKFLFVINSFHSIPIFFPYFDH